MWQTPAASSSRKGLSLAREAFRRVMSRTYHLPCPAHGSLCGKTLRLAPVVIRFVAPVECVDPELVVPDHLARLDGVSIVELLAAAALGLEMFRLLLPRSEGFFVREADEVDFLSILGGVCLDRDESRNLLDQLMHAAGRLPVCFRVRALPQVRLENHDDFRGILDAAIGHASLLPGSLAHQGERSATACTFAAAPYCRSFRRYTSFRPDHVSSTAQTFTSTRPLAKATPRTTSSVRSVRTFAPRLGQETQTHPSFEMASFHRANRASNAARVRPNASLMLTGPFNRDRIETRSGIRPRS